MAMLPKKKLEWREGQNLIKFLTWLIPNQNFSSWPVMLNDLELMPDADFERLYNEFLAEGNEAKG